MAAAAASPLARPRTSNAHRPTANRRQLDVSPSRRKAYSRNSSYANLSSLSSLMPVDLAVSDEKLDAAASPDDHNSLSTDFSDLTDKDPLLSRSLDVEKQPYASIRKKSFHPPTVAAEYEVPTRKKLTYLAVYFGLNLTLTIYNKAVLGEFAFPWLLTTVHTSCAALGCYILMLRGVFKLTKLSTRENMVLFAFSLLFTINIAISNVSLAAVSVPFHQIMRSTVPLFAVLIYRFYFNRSYNSATYFSLVPIVLGVALATYGDYYFTFTGFVLTLLGVVLAAVKTVVTNRFMTGSLALPALEVLLRMSPLAALQSIMYAMATGESGRFMAFVRTEGLPFDLLMALLGNGVLAFVLNVSSFQTNKLAGALTLTVSGNLKQCLTILLGIMLFDVKVSPTNGLGMAITIVGAAMYSKVELDSKGRRAAAAAQASVLPKFVAANGSHLHPPVPVNGSADGR